MSNESRGTNAAPGVRTRLVQAGRDASLSFGFVNPPIVRGSTVLYPDVATLRDRKSTRYPYGLTNTPTLEALTNAVNELEGAAGTVLLPSGLAAVTVAMLSLVDAGDRVLVPDNVYLPTRFFCDGTLKRLGVETVYYDPTDTDAATRLVSEGVALLLVEAPGSQTFETPDIGALLEAARDAGARTAIDNTWATPLIFRPLDHGFDLSIQAGTKYYGGHSDLLSGTISANERAWPALERTHRDLGVQVGTEEAFLTLRGMRTLDLRLRQHEESALDIARWLQGRSEVSRVLHPALASCPGHEHWKTYMGRSCGLFGVVLDTDMARAEAFLDALTLFGLGFSWGGYESLAVICELERARTARPWTDGPVVRLHIGLEDPADLKADLVQAFGAMNG